MGTCVPKYAFYMVTRYDEGIGWLVGAGVGGSGAGVVPWGGTKAILGWYWAGTEVVAYCAVRGVVRRSGIVIIRVLRVHGC